MSSQERIRLSNDWRGYRASETIKVNKIVANALVEQGIGVYENPKKPVEKELKKMNKDIKGAPKDKMLKSAPVTK
ncbi:hypothetical protein ES708_25288 [subsurface metagenome]